MIGQIIMMFQNSSLNAADISASGLSAERHRMEVIANNIANAYTTRTPEGGPFRRQNVVFQTMYDQAAGISKGPGAGFQGVSIVDVVQDQSELPLVYNPGHPDADENGMVAMPNVSVPNEMVDLITASRSYEANLKAMKNFREMVEQTLVLLRRS